MASASDRDPRHHTQKMQQALKEIQDHLREDIQKIDEPQLKAMAIALRNAANDPKLISTYARARSEPIR